MQAFGSLAVLAALAAAIGADEARSQPLELPAIALDWLELPALNGDNLGSVRKGLLCLPAGHFRWKASPAEISQVREGIAGELASRSHTTGAAAADKFHRQSSAEVRFRLGAMLRSVEANICKPNFPGYRQAKGTMTATVEWVLFDATTDKVVAEVSSVGFGELQEASSGAEAILLERAIEASLGQFFSDQSVILALQTPPPATQHASQPAKKTRRKRD